MTLLINGSTIGEILKERFKSSEIKELDHWLEDNKRNKILYARIAFAVAICFFSTGTTIFAAGGVDAEMFRAFYEIVRIFKWVFTIKAAFEIGQKITQGCDISDLTAVIVKYAGGYIALFSLPQILSYSEKLITTIFGG